MTKRQGRGLSEKRKSGYRPRSRGSGGNDRTDSKGRPRLAVERTNSGVCRRMHVVVVTMSLVADAMSPQPGADVTMAIDIDGADTRVTPQTTNDGR